MMRAHTSGFRPGSEAAVGKSGKSSRPAHSISPLWLRLHCLMFWLKLCDGVWRGDRGAAGAEGAVHEGPLGAIRNTHAASTTLLKTSVHITADPLHSMARHGTTLPDNHWTQHDGPWHGGHAVPCAWSRRHARPTYHSCSVHACGVSLSLSLTSINPARHWSPRGLRARSS
jgi:hypothetical protein